MPIPQDLEVRPAKAEKESDSTEESVDTAGQINIDQPVMEEFEHSLSGRDQDWRPADIPSPVKGNEDHGEALCSDRAELIERLKRGESPTWVPNQSVSLTQLRIVPVRVSEPDCHCLGLFTIPLGRRSCQAIKSQSEQLPEACLPVSVTSHGEQSPQRWEMVSSLRWFWKTKQDALKTSVSLTLC